VSADAIEPQVIEGEYHRDLMSQPAAMQRTLDWLASPARWSEVRRLIDSKPWKRVVLTGMGSSFHTLHPLSLALIQAGLTPVMIETSELIHYGMPLCDAGTLIVVVSQSGGSAEILRFLDLEKHSTVLAITNTPSGRLAARADYTLLSQAGVEFTVSCKTYVCGLLAIEWLAALISGGEQADLLRRLRPLPELAESYLAAWRTHVAALSERLLGVRHLFLLGRGPSLAAAGTGALIIKESVRLHAEGMSSPAFRHGPMEMLQKQMYIAVFSGPPLTRALNHRLADELNQRGCPCDLIGPTATISALRIPEIDSMSSPVLEILPVEMMTLALAGLAGREAGRFELATKVTVTE